MGIEASADIARIAHFRRPALGIARLPSNEGRLQAEMPDFFDRRLCRSPAGASKGLALNSPRL
jgi:hypothetical protein